MTPADFLPLRAAELRALLAEGHPIDARDLDDTEYKGTSLGLPGWVEALAWKKFKKTFHRDPTSGALRGWNVRLEQNALEEPCVPKTRGGKPVTFGHYVVVDPAGHRTPQGCDRGLLIHYGLGGNAPLDPMRRVRDPLVAVTAGSVEMLLGGSYVDLGWTRVGTPAFFLLEKDGALGHREPVPRV